MNLEWSSDATKSDEGSTHTHRDWQD